MNEKISKNDSFLVVGIGASAGGLAVLKKFVKTLPEKTGMAYIIIQHLDPTHKSMLNELLDKEAKMPVKDAEDQEKVKPDHIYVIPPDTYLELDQGNIKLTEPENTRGSRKAIDHFFRSLASERGESCAGIVLSGSGGDGTAGLREIKASGGLVLAQDPDTAKHASMPLSAIQADVVDQICRVEDMMDILARFARHPLKHKKQPKKEDDWEESAEKSLDEISAILKTHEKFNVNQYKPATILRRIARRMSLTNTEKYQDYLQLLRDNEKERKQLTKDLLINVTDFFRDPESFEVLENKVIPDILDHIGKNEDIRIWVAGCASGEEAYSLAILFLEGLEKTGKKNDIKIYATDIDKHAIKTARKGFYSESIAGEVPEKYLARYFIKNDNDHRYKIQSQVRDLISFAVQNVAIDPPFNHMHFVSCRNLLIYFNRDVQEKVLSSFYFALEDHSYLFLGSSETLGNKAELFKTVSKKWRLYQKIPGHDQKNVMPHHLHVEKDYRNYQESEASNFKRKRRDTSSRSEHFRRTILQNATPPTILVDDEGRMLYSHGELDLYINFPNGEPRYDLAQVVKPSIRTRIRSALYKAKKSKEKLSFHCTVNDSKDEDIRQSVKVEITPIEEVDFADGTVYVVVFTRIENSGAGEKEKEVINKDEENTDHVNLEQELAETREELQNTIEELETSTEELKASHEEALSTNEELQSSNEELEASSEELRSLNEELTTVNDQLKDKVEELNRANNDVENFFTSTDLPTVFLDPDLKIQRYTPAAEELLNMGSGDLGRKISLFRRDLVDDDLIDECKEVLRTFQPKRKEIVDFKQRCFIRQLNPYRTEDRRIEGVVIVFYNVTELKVLTTRAESRELQQSVVTRLGMLAMSGSDPGDLMQQAVRQVSHTLKVDFCKVLKYQPEQDNLKLVAGIGWQDGLVGNFTVPDDQYSQAGYTLLAKEPVIVENLAEEKRFSGPDLLIEHNVVSGLSCLIEHSERPFGVLSIHTKEKRIFNKDDANFLVSVANMLSTAVRTRESQEAIFESEEKFRNMANSIPQFAWMTDETGYIFWYNQRWFDYTGTTLDEMKGWGWQKVHHPDHVERVVNLFKESLETGEPWEDTFPLRNKYGEYRWFLSRAQPIHDQSGRIVRWFGTNTDITEKLEKENSLQQSEDRLQLAKDSARLGLFEWDIKKNELQWEPLLREIWGIGSAQTITLDNFWQGIHPEDLSKTQKAIESSLLPGGNGHYEVTYRVINQKNQEIYWIKANGTVVFVNNQPVKMIGMVNDITEAEKARQRLIHSEERLRIAKDTAEIGIIEFNKIDGEIFIDSRIRTIFGLPDDFTFTIKEFEDNLHPDDVESIMESLINEKNQKDHQTNYRSEYRIYSRKAQGYIWVEAFTKVFFEKGRHLKTISSLIDITKRKKAELELAKAVKELKETDEKKNEFLSILGHELRNPLASMSLSLELLSKQLPEDDNILRIMMNGTNTMSRLLDDLLDLNRISQNRIDLEKETIDIKQVLEDVVKTYESMIKKNDLKVDLSVDNQLPVLGDRIRLEQIFTNLLINSVKYSPRGGYISIQANHHGGGVQVEVKDNGIGLSESLLEKIFEPFYQVKQQDQVTQGLGIGLALVKKLAELHGGTVKAYSEGLNKGSAFTITLPMHVEKEEPESGGLSGKDSQLRSEIKVLLIDDNQDILITMPAVLKRIGCEVETAANGEEGLEKFRSFDWDAIIVDIGLPDMTGHEIAEIIRADGYKGLMIAISGYSHREVREKSKEVGFDRHLAKPPKLEELTTLLLNVSSNGN